MRDPIKPVRDKKDHAAALAEVGRFKEAVEIEKRAKQAAEKAGSQPTLNGINERLKLFEAGKPFRDSQ